jgi:predicted ATP-binding protein involved in virulence
MLRGEPDLRIDRLTLRNFRGYEEKTFTFQPHMNVLIGPNASGKTTILEALSVALGSLFLGIRGYESRNIKAEDVRLVSHRNASTLTFERQYPVIIESEGVVFGKSIKWARSLSGPQNRTTHKDALSMLATSTEADAAVRDNREIILPIVAYYGNGRLWLEPRDTGKFEKGEHKDTLSRFRGYYLALDPRCSPKELMRWVRRQEMIAFKEKKEKEVYSSVKLALKGAIENVDDVSFDPERDELVLRFTNGKELPFETLSDGQRGIAALVGDLGMRASRLNPHLGADALKCTPGVVLIDEVDLYLHPKWQRNILKNLSMIFPEIQFICTTHSPQVIGEIESNCIVSLNDAAVPLSFGLDSNSILKEVMDTPECDIDIQQKYEEIDSLLDQERFIEAKSLLNGIIEKIGGSTVVTTRYETLIGNLLALKDN